MIMCQKCLDALHGIWPGLSWDEYSDLLWVCTPFPAGDHEHVRRMLQDYHDRSGGDVGRAYDLARADLNKARQKARDEG